MRNGWKVVCWVVLLGFIAAGAVLAQTGIPPKIQNPKSKILTITVPGEGQYVARPLPSPDGKEQAQFPYVFTGPKGALTLDTTGLGKSPRLAIDDTKTGNTALLPLPSGDTLTVHRTDFDHVRRVEVRVTYDNKPVQSAQVTLAASDGKARVQAIDPSKQGTALFDDVPAGKAKLTVLYGDKLTMTQDVDISTDHSGDKIALTAAVTNKVPTQDVPAAAPPVSGPSAPGPPAPNSGGVGSAPATPAQEAGGGLMSLLSFIIGIAVIAGLGFLLWKWFQSGGMAATLKKAGIEVSGPAAPSDAGTPWQPNAPAPPVVADPSLCPFCGQKKDAAGNCACTLASGPSPAAAGGGGPGAVPGQPRLVATMGAYSGSIFPIGANGGVTVGRDPTNSIALSGDTTVSRRHASLRMENATCIVTDEGSSNGVYVNGVRISGSQALRPGDEVQIGNTRFRFEL
jgi:hypothetical protein